LSFRIGFGYDVHPLVEGKNFALGGISIPHSKGASGHSDADVLIHAICDALLGAAGLRDIGVYFPNTDADYKNIDSKILLEKVTALIAEKKYRVSNIDCTVCLESPKINPHIESMKKTLSGVMKIDTSQISIKATTNEKMGFVGREEGITAYAVCLITNDD
jgi:2-C-methyl-D-erythritol 2,4-cyclodiphosphate synthase